MRRRPEQGIERLLWGKERRLPHPKSEVLDNRPVTDEGMIAFAITDRSSG
jgi:hypothetical protein